MLYFLVEKSGFGTETNWYWSQLLINILFIADDELLKFMKQVCVFSIILCGIMRMI